MNIVTGSYCSAAFFVTVTARRDRSAWMLQDPGVQQWTVPGNTSPHLTARFVSDGSKTDFAGVSNGSETRHKVSVGGKERNAFIGSIAGDHDTTYRYPATFVYGRHDLGLSTE